MHIKETNNLNNYGVKKHLVHVFTLGLRSSSSVPIKDGAYYCYCAYVLRISRYSSFLLVMLTNTGIFLHGLKLSGESR